MSAILCSTFYALTTIQRNDNNGNKTIEKMLVYCKVLTCRKLVYEKQCLLKRTEQ